MTIHFTTLRDWLDWQEGLHHQVIDLGLERVATVFRALIPTGINAPVITVAGTNGKGSCIAMLESIYRAQGYRVGAYTSPHILRYNERIRINGEPVADEPIIAAFKRIEACRNGVSLSYFEFSTLAALDIFCSAHLDVLLLEVGLGGRLDAVNIVDPDVAIISSIDIDHAEWLGDTREAIAVEKAGIFRAHKPAIVGDPDPPCSLLAVALEKQADLLLLGRAFHYQRHTHAWDWQWSEYQHNGLPFPALKGSHQFRNAAAVLTAVHQLQSSLPITTSAIHQGLSGVQLKGRFQLINASVPVLLDVGHNPQAVKTLYEYVHDVFPHKRIHAVFAMMKDKDIKAVIDIMSPLIYDWTLAPLQNQRAASSELLLDLFAQAKITAVRGNFANFTAAIQQVEHNAQPEDLILVFGSFFLVSAYLAEYEHDGVAEVGMLTTTQTEQLNNGVQGSSPGSQECAEEVPCR